VVSLRYNLASALKIPSWGEVILYFGADSGNGFSPRSGFVQPYSQAGLRKSAQPLTFTLGI
jgi:hypothetical protein